MFTNSVKTKLLRKYNLEEAADLLGSLKSRGSEHSVQKVKMN